MATEVSNIQRSYSIIPCFIFVELVIMAGTVLLAYYFECTDTFEVHVQGFFCQDADLLKPYPGPEEDSFIPPIILYCVLAAAPTIIIFIGEISMYFIKSTRENLLRQEKTIVTGECCYLSPLLRRIIRFIGTDCRSRSRFITSERICTGNPDVIANARRSFPSKDASLSIYCALYATMYITSTIKTKSSRLAKPVLCLGALCAAFLTGLNRVSEYRNHCSDVIAGFVLGSTVALFLGICVVQNFKGTQTTTVKQKPKDPQGVPLMTFPRVESPLETLSAQVGDIDSPPERGCFVPGSFSRTSQIPKSTGEPLCFNNRSDLKRNSSSLLNKNIQIGTFL
ncbi:phospholipid phosphatase-related protein type 1 isoform X5 [Rhinoraja longicauda]